MKGNYTNLVSLAQEIERVEASKQDYLISNNNILMKNDAELALSGIGDFALTDFAHGQVANKLSIPKAYYDRMAEIEGLRTINVNEWLRKEPKTQLVRTIDNKARAFLSNAFRPIDNFDVLSAFLPVVYDLPVEINSCGLSDKKLYLQISFKNLEGEVKPGDVVRYGFMLTNSEVGAGAVDIKKMIWRLVCMNGAVSASLLRKFHVGSRIDSDNADIFGNDTIKAELDAFKLRLRDIIKDAISQKSFEIELAKLKGAVEDEITKPESIIKNVTKRYNLSEKFNETILENMIVENNINRYGLVNGITALAKSIEDVDKQYEVEKVGGAIIEMSRNEWGKFVQAVA